MFSYRYMRLALLSLSLLVANYSLSQDVYNNDLSFSIIITAESSGSLEAMVVQGGSWFTKRKLVHTAVLVSHPKGDLLFDSGIGEQFLDQMSVFNFFEKQLFKIENVQPARKQLDTNKYDVSQLLAIIPSHMHWDHASGLEDFSDTPIWIQEKSYIEAQAGQPPGFVKSQYDDVNLSWQYIELENIPYEGFQSSLDIYGDGSAVLVDLSGHTQGQLGLFLNLAAGERFFFIGDTTWSALGVVNNKPRPVFVDWLVGVDTDFEQNSLMIKKIHSLSKSDPKLTIVPAHDELIISNLPIYPEFSK